MDEEEGEKLTPESTLGEAQKIFDLQKKKGLKGTLLEEEFKLNPNHHPAVTKAEEILRGKRGHKSHRKKDEAQLPSDKEYYWQLRKLRDLSRQVSNKLKNDSEAWVLTHQKSGTENNMEAVVERTLEINGDRLVFLLNLGGEDDQRLKIVRERDLENQYGDQNKEVIDEIILDNSGFRMYRNRINNYGDVLPEEHFVSSNSPRQNITHQSTPRALQIAEHYLNLYNRS